MTDKKKDSEGTDQDKSEETAMDRKLDQIADKAASRRASNPNSALMKNTALLRNDRSSPSSPDG